MKKQAIVILCYALLILLGGMIGFAKAHSLPSLIMGSLFAGILIVCSFLMFKGVHWAYPVSATMTLFLLAFFSYRFYMSLKWMPAGIMVIASLLTLLLLYKPFSKNCKSCH